MSKTKVEHKREVYTIMKLIGDLGGVFEIIIGFIAIFLVPYDDLTFTMEAIEKFYSLKPAEHNRNEKKKPSSKSNNLAIELSTMDWLRLFFAEKICKCGLYSAGSRTGHLQRLHRKGLEKIEEDFSSEKLLKTLHEITSVIQSDVRYETEIDPYNDEIELE
jgi:hypothetical protein